VSSTFVCGRGVAGIQLPDSKNRRPLTQAELDKRYMGPQFRIDVRYTFIMNTVFVTLFFW